MYRGLLDTTDEEERLEDWLNHALAVCENPWSCNTGCPAGHGVLFGCLQLLMTVA